SPPSVVAGPVSEQLPVLCQVRCQSSDESRIHFAVSPNARSPMISVLVSRVAGARSGQGFGTAEVVRRPDWTSIEQARRPSLVPVNRTQLSFPFLSRQDPLVIVGDAAQIEPATQVALLKPRLESAEQPPHDLDVLLRHRPRSISPKGAAIRGSGYGPG